MDPRKHILEDFQSMELALTNHNKHISRTPLFGSVVAYALEIQVRHGQQICASDRNKDNKASRPPSFLINQNIEEFVLTQVDKLLHELLNKSDPQTPSPE
ncbi:MAG: hypothetical protein EZS28_044210 [Streblomastix strix]|uniref:Uncharacterized protein n=1 Tax=Streblomastix strix TaxID=222440 RepID=A0A5J4TQR2_9EUKA|nr:MAG: hypothetical protein EZS28_044210 [Streblomastix strix]